MYTLGFQEEELADVHRRQKRRLEVAQEDEATQLRGQRVHDRATGGPAEEGEQREEELRDRHRREQEKLLERCLAERENEATIEVALARSAALLPEFVHSAAVIAPELSHRSVGWGEGSSSTTDVAVDVPADSCSGDEGDNAETEMYDDRKVADNAIPSVDVFKETEDVKGGDEGGNGVLRSLRLQLRSNVSGADIAVKNLRRVGNRERKPSAKANEAAGQEPEQIAAAQAGYSRKRPHSRRQREPQEEDEGSLDEGMSKKTGKVERKKCGHGKRR